MTRPYDGFDPVPADDPQGEQDCHAWLNLDIDMVSIGDTGLHDLRGGDLSGPPAAP